MLDVGVRGGRDLRKVGLGWSGAEGLCGSAVRVW